MQDKQKRGFDPISQIVRRHLDEKSDMTLISLFLTSSRLNFSLTESFLLVFPYKTIEVNWKCILYFIVC